MGRRWGEVEVEVEVEAKKDQDRDRDLERKTKIEIEIKEWSIVNCPFFLFSLEGRHCHPEATRFSVWPKDLR
jgi:hypothetical protein